MARDSSYRARQVSGEERTPMGTGQGKRSESEEEQRMSILVWGKCPNCGSRELVGGEGYWFCTICGWDELDGDGS